MIIATDLHLDEDSESIVMGEVLPGIEKAALERGDKEVALLGDLLNTRYRTHSRLIMALYDFVKASTLKGLSWSILPGNHDMYSLDGRTVLELFERIVKVYREPVVNQHGAWIPYQPTTVLFRKALDFCNSISMPHGAPLFVHQAVQGAWMNDSVQNTDGVPMEWFEKSRVQWRVISGHFHKHHVLGPVTYLGTQWQTTAAEAGQSKFIGALAYHETGAVKSLEFLPVVWGPRYVNMQASGPKVDLSQLRPNDIVNVTVADGVNLGVLGAQFAAAGIKNHTLTPEVVHKEARLNVAATATMTDYARAYVDQFTPPDLNKQKLLDIFLELVAQ